MQMKLSREEAGRLIGRLSLMDDIFFSRCFDGDRASAALMLRIILGRDDLVVTEARTQRWIQGLPGHSVKLDIAAVDSDGRLYGIEVQKADDRAIRKRARFYSAMIDAGCLDRAKGYSALPESYVIFITAGDAIGSGKALYSVDCTIGETGEPYGDGTHIVHVSASLADSSTELGRLMHDLKCTEPEAMFYNELRERTGFFKKDEGRVYMATEFEEMLEEIARERVAKARNEKIAEERAEGRRENAREAARRMIADGSIPLDKVAEFSGLPLSEVEGIRNGISL